MTSMHTTQTTIAALATPPGRGGISVVRISGPEAYSIADRIARVPGPALRERQAGTFVRGHIHPPDGDVVLDEAIILCYRAPHSYTCEDTVELQCHGGIASVKRILQAVLDAGAIPAGPGEFTQRAFLNGRIDLVQAEAVMDIIEAQSVRAAQLASEQLSGNLSKAINLLYDQLMDVAANLEASLDFGEDELPVETLPNLTIKLQEALTATRHLLNTWNEGHLLREGITVAICGRPNVGKSTLLNQLTGRDRAITSHHPGTTRDTLEESILLEGVPVRLIDTAGLRETDCSIEQEGIARARKALQNADILLWMVDASQPLSEDERDFYAHRDPGRCIIILNKCDIATSLGPKDFEGYTCITTTLTTGHGISSILETLIDRIGILDCHQSGIAISSRHRYHLQTLQISIDECLTIIRSNNPDCCLAVTALRDGIEALGKITGRIYTDDLLDRIFSSFCVGK